MEELVRLELRAMRRNGFLVFKSMLRILREEKQKAIFFRLRPQDQLRLGILQVWATRHKVPLTYVIKTLLKYWREKTRRPGKKTTLLGVTIAALTAQRSEPFLENLIENDFPNESNVAQWKVQRQMRLLGLDEMRGRAKSLINENSPDDFLYLYERRVQKRQQRLAKAVSAQWRRRRRWRGNPWL